MKNFSIEELKKIKSVIWGIYYEGLDPKEFHTLTGIENYMEELYPPEENKYVGDWIEEQFGSSLFFDTEKIKQFYSQQADKITEAYFYANFNKVVNNVSKSN